MNPALRTLLHVFGFAMGFWMLMGGGMGLALVTISLAQADLPPMDVLARTVVSLALPLFAFRAYDRRKRATP